MKKNILYEGEDPIVIESKEQAAAIIEEMLRGKSKNEENRENKTCDYTNQ